jgi:hypothetical protein
MSTEPTEALLSLYARRFEAEKSHSDGSANVTATEQRNTDRQEEITRRAYGLYLDRGCGDGRD